MIGIFHLPENCEVLLDLLTPICKPKRFFKVQHSDFLVWLSKVQQEAEGRQCFHDSLTYPRCRWSRSLFLTGCFGYMQRTD